MTIALILAAVLALPFGLLLLAALVLLALYPLRLWMGDPSKAVAEVEALTGLDAHTRSNILSSIYEGRDADRKTWLYDLFAPLVMLFVLPFVPRQADRLPRSFRAWDNDVSMNGDGWGWYDTEADCWYDTRIKPAPAGAYILSHADPEYKGDCYYAKGHHPRSFCARYVWLGWRNRASLLSLQSGVEVAERPVCISGDPTIHRNGPYGYFVLKHGNTYHYKSIQPIRILGMRLALTRSVGYKLEIPFKSAAGTGRAAAVSIGRSLKRRRG